jgi:spermidine synthase
MTAPYLLIPIALVLLILYSISLLFRRLEVISKSTHRKTWNYALLVTFLVAAVLGTLMAIQINYKMEVPWTEKALKWHVNFGIGMSMIGIFHLIWHWRYYFPLKSIRRGGAVAPHVPGRKEKNGKSRYGGNENGRSRSSSPTDWPKTKILEWIGPMGPAMWLFIVGFSGITFQTFIIRELLGLFQGNELMLSIIMFLWLLLTGAGALTGNGVRKVITDDVQEVQRKCRLFILTLLILPVFLILLMYYCKSLFFAPGIEGGPVAFSGLLILLLTPFCFLNGFAFTFMTRLLEPSGMSIRKAYAWESLGGAAAGLTCTIAILLGIFSLPGGRLIEKLFHPNDEVIATRSGPSGRITITRNGDQLNIFENGILCQSSGNTMICEEMAHFVMVQHPDPQNVLVIGGLLSGIDREILKYRCRYIDLAEPDPQIFRLAEHLSLIQPLAAPFRNIRENVTTWINHSDIQYDIIMVMLPGPQNLGLNRFYTAEFFSRLKTSMSDDGIISIMLPGTGNYVSGEAVAAIGPVVNAMRQSFSEAILFPGENNYLIAGNTSIRNDILSELKMRSISTLYISEGYFDQDLFKARMVQLNEIVKSEKTLNTYLKPRAYFGQIAWWLGQFPSQIAWPLVAILAILLISSLVSGHTAYTGMFIMGAGASGIEIILLFLIQITAGSLYLFTGLLLAVFMSGLAVGSSGLFKGRLLKIAGRSTVLLLTFTAVTAMIAMMAMWMTKTVNLTGLKTFLVILLTFMTASLTGLFFAQLTGLVSDPKSNGKLYVFDMLGAAFGSLIYPMVIIPIFGVLTGIGVISTSGVLILILLIARRNSSPN